jgi:hypothetical protein
MGVTAPDKPVKRHGPWKDNAEMMVDVHRLGYLPGTVLDVTYGLAGGFWRHHTPESFIASDLSGVANLVADFTHLPFRDRAVTTVVLDAPYKLNGTPAVESDERYGVAQPVHWRDRLALIMRGTTEVCRVADELVLIKVQDQVVSNKIRWQTDLVTRVAGVAGFEKVDRFELSSYRPQPAGRGQNHTRADTSQLLIFRRTK